MLRPCAHSPETTVVVLIELIGQAYEKIQHKMSATLPSLKDILPPEPNGASTTITTVVTSWESPLPVVAPPSPDTVLAANLEHSLSLDQTVAEGTTAPPHII